MASSARRAHCSCLSRPTPLLAVVTLHHGPTMASSPLPPGCPPLRAAETVPGAVETEPEAAPKKGKDGKNLTWSALELLALAETAPITLEDAAVGSGQTAHKMGLRLRARFLERARPQNGTESGTGTELDSRRWEGRTGRACKTRWDMVKAASFVYEQAVEFVAAARVTENPKPEQLQRCHVACYNAHHDGLGMGARTKHLTAIAMDEHYPVRDPFEIFECWRFLSENTTLLKTTAENVGVGAGVGEAVSGAAAPTAAPHGAAQTVVDAGAADPERAARPQKGKAAMLEKAHKRKLECNGEDGDTEGVAILSRMDSIAASLEKETKRRHLRHKQNQRVQADKLALVAFKTRYAGATLSLDGRHLALKELREEYLREAGGDVDDADERHRAAAADSTAEDTTRLATTTQAERKSDHDE